MLLGSRETSEQPNLVYFVKGKATKRSKRMRYIGTRVHGWSIRLSAILWLLFYANYTVAQFDGSSDPSTLHNQGKNQAHSYPSYEANSRWSNSERRNILTQSLPSTKVELGERVNINYGASQSLGSVDPGCEPSFRLNPSCLPRSDSLQSKKVMEGQNGGDEHAVKAFLKPCISAKISPQSSSVIKSLDKPQLPVATGSSVKMEPIPGSAEVEDNFRNQKYIDKSWKKGDGEHFVASPKNVRLSMGSSKTADLIAPNYNKNAEEAKVKTSALQTASSPVMSVGSVSPLELQFEERASSSFQKDGDNDAYELYQRGSKNSKQFAKAELPVDSYMRSFFGGLETIRVTKVVLSLSQVKVCGFYKQPAKVRMKQVAKSDGLHKSPAFQVTERKSPIERHPKLEPKPTPLSTEVKMRQRHLRLAEQVITEDANSYVNIFHPKREGLRRLEKSYDIGELENSRANPELNAYTENYNCFSLKTSYRPFQEYAWQILLAKLEKQVSEGGGRPETLSLQLKHEINDDISTQGDFMATLMESMKIMGFRHLEIDNTFSLNSFYRCKMLIPALHSLLTSLDSLEEISISDKTADFVAGSPILREPTLRRVIQNGLMSPKSSGLWSSLKKLRFTAWLLGREGEESLFKWATDVNSPLRVFEMRLALDGFMKNINLPTGLPRFMNELIIGTESGRTEFKIYPFNHRVRGLIYENFGAIPAPLSMQLTFTQSALYENFYRMNEVHSILPYVRNLTLILKHFGRAWYQPTSMREESCIYSEALETLINLPKNLETLEIVVDTFSQLRTVGSSLQEHWISVNNVHKSLQHLNTLIIKNVHVTSSMLNVLGILIVEGRLKHLELDLWSCVISTQAGYFEVNGTGFTESYFYGVHGHYACTIDSLKPFVQSLQVAPNLNSLKLRLPESYNPLVTDIQSVVASKISILQF